MSQAPSSQADLQGAAGEAVVLKAIGLTKLFKDFWLRNRVRAVDGIDLEIRRGEVFGLLGPNGSGKSTTIKMILGLLNPTDGRIAVFGKPPNDVTTKKRIGYLPEETYLYRFLNPRETLDYYGKLFHQDRNQRRKRTDTLLEMVGLTHAARRPVGEFSKGMQRKVGLAQALINDPDFLILDEPTSGMDPIATAEVKEVIQRLAERGKTILLCSHLLADVQDVCDRVSIMYGGKIREQGNLDSLLADEGKLSIETDALDDSVVSEIESVLQRHGSHILRSDRPKKRLETLFLEIVDRARAEGLETAGARKGGKIADFLDTGVEDGGEATAPSQDEILSGLTEPVVPAPVAPAVSPESEAAEPDHDVDALAALTGTAPEPVVPKTPAPAKPTDTPALDADQSVLDALMGGDDNEANPVKQNDG